MPELLLNNAALYYEEEGKGDPLILLHGLTGNMLMYENEIDHLKNYFRVISLDSRGHGKSEKIPEYTLKDHIQDVIALMDYLEIKKVHLMGISMGSYIAQGVAIIAPDRIDKLLLVSAKSHGGSSSMARLFKQHEKELEGLNYPEKVKRVSGYIFKNLDAVEKSIGQTSERSIELTPEQQNAAQKALEGFDYRPDLNKVTADTLIINGKYDGLNPPKEGQEIASLIQKSTFIEFEESGHSPNIEEPEYFLKIITKFLNSKV